MYFTEMMCSSQLWWWCHNCNVVVHIMNCCYYYCPAPHKPDLNYIIMLLEDYYCPKHANILHNQTLFVALISYQILLQLLLFLQSWYVMFQCDSLKISRSLCSTNQICYYNRFTAQDKNLVFVWWSEVFKVTGTISNTCRWNIYVDIML